MVAQKIESFFSSYPRQILGKGEVLIQDNEPQPHIYFLRQGTVAQHDVSSRGDIVELTTYRQGAFFPLMTIFTGIENRFFFVARETIEYHKAPAHEVYRFLQENSEVMSDVVRRLYFGIDGLLMRMTSLLSGDAQDRILTYLKIVNARYNREKRMPFVYHTTHHEIAQYTGLSRETVSRTLRLCEEKGYIQRQSGSIILIKDSV